MRDRLVGLASLKNENGDDVVAPADDGECVPAMPREAYYRNVSRAERFIPARAWPVILKRLLVELVYRGLLDRGATLAFYTLLTAVPTLMAFYSISTLVLDQNREKVTQITDEFITRNVPTTFIEQARSIIDMIIGSTQQSMVSLVISMLIALFSSSAYVRAFSRSANALYGRHEGRNLIHTWLTMWGLTIVLVLGLVGIAGGFFLREDLVEPFLNNVAGPLRLEEEARFLLEQFLPVWAYVRWPVIIALSVMLVAVLYHFAPNVHYGRVRWLTTGSSVALIGVTIVAIGVQIYVNNFAHLGMYGALGGVIGVLMGLLFANTLLLAGLKLDAEVTRVRELQAGLDSAQLIRVPPRSSATADKNRTVLQRMIRDVSRFKS